MKNLIYSIAILFCASVIASAQNPVLTPVPSPTRIPVQLPDEPMPVAPKFEAVIRPLPSADRIGVDVSDQLPISLQDAIKLALQNNNDIDASKIDVKIAEYGLQASQGQPFLQSRF